MSSLKIALVDLGVVWGGQEIYSTALGQALVQRGHQVLSLSHLDRFGERMQHREPMSAAYSAFMVNARRLQQVQRDVDLVHFNGNRALYLSRLAPHVRPFVGTKHLPYGIDVKPWTRALGSVAAPTLFGQIDTIISVCQATRDELPASVRSKTVVIPNGVPSYQAPGVTRAETFTLVYVARLTASKGILDALDAVRRLRDQGLSLRFLVAGDGDMRAEAESFVRSHKLESVVTFLGFATSVGPLYSQAHACILPSRHEGMPLNLLEAFSAGCPVIAYNIPGVDEVVEPSVNGILVPVKHIAELADALRRLIEDQTLQQRLAMGALAGYEAHYQLDRMVERTLDVYNSVL